MSEDPLDKETSVSLQLSESGIEGKAKSRTVAAIDRLLGNVLDLANVAIEENLQPRRAKVEGQKKLIEAAAQKGVELIQGDPEFAERALANHFDGIAKKQANKDAVVAEALEDLREAPPTTSEQAKGDDRLDEVFIDRLEHYAEFASTDQLRRRWGRVLASEIRQPGTFSQKVLRVVDEMDAATASTFERLCLSRLERTVPRAIAGELSFRDTMVLTTAELLLEPSLGQLRSARPAKDSDGTELHVFGFGSYAVAVPTDADVPTATLGQLLEIAPVRRKSAKEPEPVVPIYLLTDVGAAIASILPDHQRDVAVKLAEQMAASTGSPVRVYQDSGHELRVIEIMEPPSAS